MFKKGEYILYGTVGVCQVEGISKPDFSNNDKVYYSLVPKFDQDTTIYTGGQPKGKDEGNHDQAGSRAVHTGPAVC